METPADELKRTALAPFAAFNVHRYLVLSLRTTYYVTTIHNHYDYHHHHHYYRTVAHIDARLPRILDTSVESI